MKTTLLTALLLLLTAAPGLAQPLPRATPEQLGLHTAPLRHAEQALQRAIDNHEIPGAVLAVVHRGHMAYIRSFGHRTVEPSLQPMHTRVLFDLASLTKPFTALAIHILHDQGRLQLTDKANRYLPGLDDRLQILHLLTHSSGLPPYVPIDTLRKHYAHLTPDSLIHYIANLPLTTAPGTHFTYSCLNYIALQRIIETITRQPLDHFLHTTVFLPLGMEHTTFLPTGAALTDVAPTERQADGSLLTGVPHDPLARIANQGVSGNAGLFTTADDLALFAATLLNPRLRSGQPLLSPASHRLYTTVPPDLTFTGRSPGWDLHSPYATSHGHILSPATYGHTGYTGTSLLIDPTRDLAIILLTNRVHPTDTGHIGPLRTLIANAIAASIPDSTIDLGDLKHPTPPSTDFIPDSHYTTAEPTDPTAEPPVRTYHPHYYERLQAFYREPPIRETDIILLGNSLIENGKWELYFPKQPLVNRGVGGDEALGIADRLSQILPFRPAKIFLQTGANDVANGYPIDTIVARIARLVDRIQRESPSTLLYLQGSLPINESFARYARLTGHTPTFPVLNARLEALAADRGLPFVALFHLFALPDAPILNPAFTTDGLHLTPDTYALWAEALRPYIEE